MTSLIRNQKDFGAGVIYVAFGAATLMIGREYPLGTGARMGPGYFPAILGGLLLVFGVAALLRSFLKDGEAVTNIAWKPLFLIVCATVLFGLLLMPAGVIVALVALIVMSALASRNTRLNTTSVLSVIGIIAFCVLVFVKGLGLPLPLLGTWLGE